MGVSPIHSPLERLAHGLWRPCHVMAVHGSLAMNDISRRDVIRGGLLAGAASMLSPSILLARDEPKPGNAAHDLRRR